MRLSTPWRPHKPSPRTKVCAARFKSRVARSPGEKCSVTSCMKGHGHEMGNTEGHRASLRHGNHHVRGESLRPEWAFQQVEARAREGAKAARLPADCRTVGASSASEAAVHSVSDRFASLIGLKVRVAQGHVAGAVTQKLTHCVQRNAVLDQAQISSEVKRMVCGAPCLDRLPRPIMPCRLSRRLPRRMNESSPSDCTKVPFAL
jgi:hypothetical protein